MNRIAFIGLTSMIMVFTVSCKKDVDHEQNVPSNKPVIAFNFDNVIDGIPVQTTQISYTNAAGNLYSVGDMKYYISNITLVKPGGEEVNAGNYKLIDVSDPATGKFELEGFEEGDYIAVKMYLGVDSVQNISGPQLGDLDPTNGMLWDWHSGYIFFKHEGSFIDSTGYQEGIYYHYGTIAALVTLEFPINLSLKTEHMPTFHMIFDINRLYSTPNQIDFNGNYIHQSNGPNDAQWLKDMRENFHFAFELDHID